MATSTTTIADGDVPGPTPRPRRGGVALRLSTVAVAGALLFASFAPRELWWLAPVAFALLWPVLHGRRTRAGFGYGFVFGLAFYLPLLPWTGEFVGAVPWIALSTLQALGPGIAGALIASITRGPLARRLPTGLLLLAGTSAWIVGEAVMARVPFDGFPWGRAAYSQPGGLLLPIAALGGAPLLSAAVALIGFGLGEALRRALDGQRGARVLAVPVVVALVAPVVGLAATPLVGTDPQNGTATVAVVQGNVPRLGLEFNAQRRAVLDNHVRRTEELAADVDAGRVARPDLVIWPENASDIDPIRNADAGAEIDRAARDIGAPIAVGSVFQRPGQRPTNTVVVWDPVTGPGQEHDKRRLQPFGEYMPYRDFFRMFSPLVDRASDFAPGEGDGVLDIAGVPVGIATCYEVVFDDLVRSSVRNGAQLIAVPTNNATFGLTEMTFQQQAMSRVRAVEHGRAVVISATSGSSAVIAPDGTVLQRTGLFEPAALVAEVPLRTGTTLATRLGAGPELLLVVIGVVAVLGAAVLRRRDVTDPAQPAG